MELAIVDERIKEHLKLLNRYYLQLDEIRKIEKSKFLGDAVNEACAERYLQLAIESCLNIGNRLISLYQFKKPVKTPETYSDIFVEMSKIGVIDNEFSEKLVKMTQFRNRLVHLYWILEPDQVYQIIQEDLDDFRKFQKNVVDYLNENPTGMNEQSV
jgi:uncharacterized protein YutE (UPF0331/DUF86 family)